MARMKDQYRNEYAPALMKKFGYTSVMQIPKLDKVVINVGCGEARDNPKIIDVEVQGICCEVVSLRQVRKATLMKSY